MHRIASLILALLLSTLTACTDANSCPDSAQQFWTKFRAAVLKDDFDALAAMTRFPLEVGSDYDAQKFIYRKNFNKHFTTLLGYELNSNYGSIRPRPASMKELARAVTNVSSLCMPGGDEISGDQLNVGTWTFLSKPDGWRLVEVSSNDFVFAETEEPQPTTPTGK